jgi:hypothetical protein
VGEGRREIRPSDVQPSANARLTRIADGVLATVDPGTSGTTIWCRRPFEGEGVEASRWLAVATSRRDRSRSVTREEDTMKFMFMIYHDEHVLDALPEGEMQALVDSALDYDDEIRRSGHYIVSEALQPARTARILRVSGGKVSTTDGPFAETKEQLGGFFLIEARDMVEACEVASRFPPARLGIIEVRAVQELQHS